MNEYVTTAAAGLASSPVAAVAVAAACAGALTQRPRIMELEKELKLVKAELNATVDTMETRVSELEDKLFAMDQAYEEQSAKFRRQYDDQKKKELEQLQEKMKVDYQYRMEIQLQKERSQLLMDNLEQESTRTADQATLVQMRVEKERVSKANDELEKALLEAQEELELINSGKVVNNKKKNGLFGWLKP